MYAVIETGGKQYRVEVGTQLEVELIDAKAGDTVTLDRVLLVADGETATIGRPVVAEASVSAEVLRQERGEKVIAFKYRPKARRRVKKGHRQELHVLRIADIVLNGKSAAAVVKKAEAEAKTERQRLEEAARRQAAEDAALAAKLAAARTPKAETEGHRGRAEAEGRRRASRAARRPNPPPRPSRRPRQGRARRSRAADEAGRRRQAGDPAEAPHREEGRVDPMAHKKAGSSSKNGRDSVGQRLGVKVGDGQLVPAGSIIVRQRGMTFLAGDGAGLGRDYTVFATVTGKVRFEHQTKSKKRIRVEPVAADA